MVVYPCDGVGVRKGNRREDAFLPRNSWLGGFQGGVALPRLFVGWRAASNPSWGSSPKLCLALTGFPRKTVFFQGPRRSHETVRSGKGGGTIEGGNLKKCFHRSGQVRIFTWTE